MPTYQYACTECGHAFEQFQSFSDASLTECPECEGRLRKVYNAVGVVFKGSGFYRTDSRSGSASSDSSSTPAAATSGDSSSGTTSTPGTPSTSAPSTSAPSTSKAGASSSTSTAAAS